MTVGQKENPNREPQVAESIFPFTDVGFLRYPVFLTHSHVTVGHNYHGSWLLKGSSHRRRLSDNFKPSSLGFGTKKRGIAEFLGYIGPLPKFGWN